MTKQVALRDQSGAVFFELAAVVPLLVMILGLLLAVASPLNSRAGAISAARDLARYGVGYDLVVPRTDGRGGMKSACEMVCERASSVICSHGLDSSKYAVNTGRDGDSFTVELSRGKAQFFSYFVAGGDSVQAAFTLESTALAGWDSSGCGTCSSQSCSG